HQPAPVDGPVLTTQSTIESDGFSIGNFAEFSEPPPLGAILASPVPPGTTSKWMTAGVLSRELARFPAGSWRIDARRLLSGCKYARRTPSFTMSATDIVAPSQRTSIPTLTNAQTIPVS